MAPDVQARHEDPLDGLRTVHLIEEALVQRGLRQLRDLLREGDGKQLLDRISAAALANVHEIEEVLAQWQTTRGGPPAPRVHLPEPDRAEILRSFVDLKETEALVLARAAKVAPDSLRPRLERLARDADDHARGLAKLLPPEP